MEQEALLDLFLQEAQAQQGEIEMLLTELEKNPKQYAPLEAIFRYMHTIKANAFALDLKPIGELTHLIEDIFNEIRKNNISLESDSSWITELFRANDKLGELLNAVRSQEKVTYKGLLTMLKVKLDQAREQNSILSPSTKEEKIPDQQTEDLAEPEKIDEPTEEKKIENIVKEADINKALPKNIQFHDTVQITVQKLDALLNLAGEIGIERDRLLTIAPQKKQLDKKDFHQLHRLTSELQYSVIQARLVKVEVLFQKFHRVVRDVAMAEGKKVKLVLEGTDIEIDRNILQVISDSMVHLVRNAIGHGLEESTERLKHGKPLEGTITLRAYNEKDKVIIEVKDDGRGIEEESIRRKLVEKEWLSEAEVKNMLRQQIFQQLFESGFSSADTITEISGRGVGLDVVKSAVDSAGGKILILTEEGKGTTFQMHLPVSMMLKSVLFFTLDEQIYGIPLMYVEGVCALAKQEVFSVGAGEMIYYQNQNIPLIDLRKYFYLAKETMNDSELDFEGKEVGLIIADTSRKICLKVNRLLNQKEIIEKQLPPMVQSISVFSGATILGTGDVCLILDVLNILRNNKNKTQY
jgi:two-component system chemotaxis sensor kinase CheA